MVLSFDNLKNNADERAISLLATTGIVSFLWIPVAVALFVVPLHEALHYVGAYIEGGHVTDHTFLNVDAWISQYFFPLVPNGPLGTVTAEIPDKMVLGLFPPGTIFYFLPYIVLIPLALYMLAGDNAGISNKWRLIGAPMLYTNIVAFFNEYALYTGGEVVYPFPPVVFQAFYISVILIGFVGTTWLFILRDVQKN